MIIMRCLFLLLGVCAFSGPLFSSENDLLKLLEQNNYWAYSIDSLRVIDAAPTVANEDRPLPEWQLQEGEADLIINGTFTGDIPTCFHCIPLAAVMRDGIMDAEGVTKTRQRGGIAILKDGSIIIGRAQGATYQSIQKAFGTEKNPVWEFMGGGALLIENGLKVSSQDLLERQKFDQGGGGIDSEQMRKTNHMVLAQKGAARYVIVAKNKTGKEIQEQLSNYGFEQVLKFDGGSGIFLRDRKNPGRAISGSNSTGFAVLLKN